MAYSLNPGDIVEVTYRSQLFVNIMMSVLHYKYIGAAPIANGQAALSTLLTSLAAAGKLRERYLACCGPELLMVEERAQVVYPTRQVYTLNALGNAGTNAGTCTAPNVAATIIKSPDQAGHGRSGSLHIPGVPAAAYVAGQITGAYTVLVSLLGQEVAAQSYSFGAANDAQAVIWSPVRPANPSTILGFRVNPYVRTMHRRTLSLGI